MSKNIWLGDAQPIAQVTTITLTVGSGILTTDLYKIKIGDKTMTVVAGATTIIAVAANIAAAWNALNVAAYPEFRQDITLVDNLNGTLTLTGAKLGVPFTITLTYTLAGGGAGGGTFTQATGTAATGGMFWDNINNWSLGAVPVAGDDVVFQFSSNPCRYNMSPALTGANKLASLTIDQSFTGDIGLPRVNAAGYIEYRSRYLTLGATAVNYGRGSGAGSQLIRLQLGTDQTTVNVYNSNQPSEAGAKALCLLATHASNILIVDKGSVGVGIFAGDTAQFATLKVGYINNINSDSDVKCGDGVTLANITKTGGQLEMNAGISGTLTDQGGVTVWNAGNIPTPIINGGTLIYKGAGTLGGAGSPAVGNGGTIDFSQDLQARTQTNMTVNAGGNWLDPNKTVTLTNPMVCTAPLVGTAKGATVKLDFGPSFSPTR